MLIACLLASAAASSLTPDLRPKSVDRALMLRGGAALPSASLFAASPTSSKSRKATFALGANALVSTAYGILSISNPNAMLSIYGVTTKLDFMSPAFGVCQYLGGMYLAVALRCFAALGVPGLPARDVQETLQGMAAWHAIAGAVAGFRQLKGSSSPVVGSILMAGLAYWAQRE